MGGRSVEVRDGAQGPRLLTLTCDLGLSDPSSGPGR